MTRPSWFALGVAMLSAIAWVYRIAPRPADATTPVAPPWGSILKGGGARAADAAIARVTPPCVEFGDRGALERWGRNLRREVVARLGIDLHRRVKSAVIQRSLWLGDQEVEVVRLEVFDGLYLPVNVYLPVRRDVTAPVVVAPLGCSGSLGSAEPQSLGANLANLGMIAVLTEGFCYNGARQQTFDIPAGYSRQLLGLRSDTAVYLQELVSALTWAIEAHPFAHRSRAGAAGYSYGGQLSLLLALVDERVSSISIPATGIGGACEAGPAPVEDAYIGRGQGLAFAWTAPIEVRPAAVNWRVAALFPRSLHTTAGTRDKGAPAPVIGGAMQYASALWRMGGVSDRLLFRTDEGDHNFGSERREDTYNWLARTLLGRRGRRLVERSFTPRPAGRFAVDIAGTRSLLDELRSVAQAEHSARFSLGHPKPEAIVAARRAATTLFDQQPEALVELPSWSGVWDGLHVRALRSRGTVFDVPTLVIEGHGPAGSGTLLYLPERGISTELVLIRDRARQFEKIVVAEYLGIGELASDRLMLNTLAITLMYSRQSLPAMNTALLRGVLRRFTTGPVTIEGRGWAASLYACLLRVLEPGRVRLVHVAGVPQDELAFLGSGARVPDLLLHPRLFCSLSVAELVQAGDEVEAHTTGRNPMPASFD